MITCDLSLVKHKWNCAIVILAKPRLFQIVNPACCLRRRRRRIPISKREQIDHVIHPKDILYLLSSVQPHAIDRINAIVLEILFSAISIAYVVRRAGFFSFHPVIVVVAFFIPILQVSMLPLLYLFHNFSITFSGLLLFCATYHFKN